MIAREQRRLGALFQRAILIAVAGVGCSTKAADAVSMSDPTLTDGGDGDGGVRAEGGHEGGQLDKCSPQMYSPIPADTCGLYYTYPCGLPEGLTSRGDCYFAVNDCAILCADIHYNCHAVQGYCTEAGVDGGDEGGTVVPDEAGAVVVDCSICPGSAGRAPEGLVSAKVHASSMLGAYFASAARLEAASVVAFARLREELSLHDAPSELLDGVLAAERDEVEHTRLMTDLAYRHGGRCEPPQVKAVGTRSLEDIARENAVEGCARETFGALLATWQASHVDDAELAATLATIAEDETRHAALSWSIARWSISKLDRDATERMQNAWMAAIDDLLVRDASLTPSQAAELDVLGFPSPAEQATLARELRPLWGSLLAAA